MNDELKKWIKENLINTRGRVIGKKFNKIINTERGQQIMLLTSFLKESVKPAERIYCVLNDIIEYPKCPTCNLIVYKFIHSNSGYNTYCSVKCMYNNSEVISKRKKTNIKKYGTEYPCQNKKVLENRKQTNIKKYGKSTPLQNEKIKEKIKNTNIEKYGVENVFSSEKIRKKAKETNIRKYGSSHAMKNDDVKRKFKDSMLNKYGVKHALQFNEFKEKYKKTCQKHFGVDNPLQSKKVQLKIAKTNIEKYGVESVFQSKEIRDRIRNIMLEKYGTEHALQVDKFKEKSKKTCQEHFGVDNSFQSEEVREKIKKTNIEKYGVENVLQLEENREKAKKINIEKFDCEYFFQSKKYKHQLNKRKITSQSQSHIDTEVLRKINDKSWLENQHLVLQKSCFQIGQELNLCPSTIVKRLHRFEIEVKNFFQSQFEIEIKKHIGDCFHNIRNIISPYELDIYLPDYKLAIEFDGLYWHSSYDKESDKKLKSYHLMKTKMCEEQNIQLLHIFENEWLDEKKQDIWKSIINSKLGKNDRISARKCKVKEISDSSLIGNFLDDNHLQGFVGSSVKIGLFHEEELVSLMTFGKVRYSSNYEWEMIRFCNKKYLNIVGGSSKLFKYFIRNYDPRSVVSYADRRHSSGKMYKKLGFEFSHVSAPNYFYFKLLDMVLYPRIKFQKHKLSKLLENFHADISEVENMYNNNFRRIWDCGNMIFVWKKR